MANTTIVVPCFNEALRLPTESFESFARKTDDLRFLLVDDGSVDGTGDLLAELACRSPSKISVLSLPHNVGKGEAVRQGMLAALDASPSYVGFWDSDLATPLETIAELQQVLENRPSIEMVFGARVKLLGRDIQRRAARHYLGRVFATTVSLILGMPVYDTQCGAKLFRVTEDLKRLLAVPFVSRWIFDVEIIYRFQRARRNTSRFTAERVIYEHPLREWHDVAGSKVGPFAFIRAAWDLIRIRLGSQGASPDATTRRRK